MIKQNRVQDLLLRDDDSESVCSFNSSEAFTRLNRTQSTISVTSQAILQTPIKKGNSDMSHTEQSPSCTQSIEAPRLAPTTQVCQQFDTMSIGFFNAKNKKNVLINDSKLKRAHSFFDDDQEDETPEFNHTMKELPQPKLIDLGDLKSQQLSLPFFENFSKGGNRNQVVIDQSLLLKANKMFLEESENMKNSKISASSFKKPTRVKQTNRVQKEIHLSKTINNPKKRAVKSTKQKFDWEIFKSSNLKLFDSERSSHLKKNQSSDNQDSEKPYSSPLVKIKLQDLDYSDFNNIVLLNKFSEEANSLSEWVFSHSKVNCKVLKCLLCRINVQNQRIDINSLYQIYSEELTINQITKEVFNEHYNAIAFKLLKFEHFHHNIINKSLCPSHILTEIHQKHSVEASQKYKGWLHHCLSQKLFFTPIIVEVRLLKHRADLNTWYALVSDGWTEAWIIIQKGNSLFSYMGRLKVLSKLFIAYWRIFSIRNIIRSSGCPDKFQHQAIEIWYNSTIIVQPHLKLGRPKSIFYRPLNRNIARGNLIPTVQGHVIRMFTEKKPEKSNRNQGTTVENAYVQILTPEGITTLIKFQLSGDKLLAEMFRLYYKYHFYFLEIGKDHSLQFSDQHSKFYEFQKRDKKKHHPDLIKLLETRFLNSMNFNQLKDLKTGNLYDFYLKDSKFKHAENVEISIIQESTELVPVKRSSQKEETLYQQYLLVKKSKQTNNLNEKEPILTLFFKRTQHSNTLKNIPLIYKAV